MIGGQDYYLELLFYQRGLAGLVASELYPSYGSHRRGLAPADLKSAVAPAGMTRRVCSYSQSSRPRSILC